MRRSSGKVAGVHTDLPRQTVRTLTAQSFERVLVDRHALLALPVGDASTTRDHGCSTRAAPVVSHGARS
eukprot:6672292-Prymnesium_polylepis.1